MRRDEVHNPARSNFLAAIRKETERRIESDWYVRTLVKAALDEEATWKAIGEALGTSAQAAWHKYASQDRRKIGPFED